LGNNTAIQNSAIDTSGAGTITVTGFTTPTFGGLIGSTDLASVITTGYSSVTGITLNPAANVTNSYSGVIANGAMKLTKSGSGTQVLSGANSYTGLTTVSAGVLNIQNAAALGTTAAGTSVTSGAALQLQNNITVGAETLALNGTGISSDGAMRNISDTNVWQGTVTLGSAARINSDAGSLTFNTAANSITGTNQNLTLGGAANGTIAGTITTGSGILTKDGTGTWTLSGNNTYTGATYVNGGTLNISGGSLGNGAYFNTTANNLTDALNITGGTVNLGYLVMNNSSNTSSGNTGQLNISGGAVAINGMDLYIGSVGSTGSNTINVSGGTLTFGTTEAHLGQGAGTAGQTTAMTISGTGTVVYNGLIVIGRGTGSANGSDVLNLESGGTLQFNAGSAVILSDGGGSFYANGGTLKAGGTNTNNVISLNSYIRNGGFIFDSNTFNYTMATALNHSNIGGDNATDGGLTKIGAGTLTLSVANTYTGATTVSAGTLALGASGSISSGVVIAAGATLDTTAKTSYTLPTTLTLGVNGTSGTSGQINATGKALVINTAHVTLNVTGTLTAPSYVLATYASETGSAFASVTGVPSGYAVTYTSTQALLSQSGSPFSTWMSTNYPSLTGANALAGADPDGDGQTNITEFALDGNPTSGAASGKVVGKIASVGGNPTLVLTLPVRTGAVFTAPGLPGNGQQVSATVDNLVYEIQGGNNLGTWTQAVTEVTGSDKTTIESTMPALSVSGAGGWTYRTFKSPVTVSGNPTEFLRAVIISQP